MHLDEGFVSESARIDTFGCEMVRDPPRKLRPDSLDPIDAFCIQLREQGLGRVPFQAGGQKPKAADLLQVSYKTFVQKLKEYGIE